MPGRIIGCIRFEQINNLLTDHFSFLLFQALLKLQTLFFISELINTRPGFFQMPLLDDIVNHAKQKRRFQIGQFQQPVKGELPFKAGHDRRQFILLYHFILIGLIIWRKTPLDNTICNY